MTEDEMKNSLEETMNNLAHNVRNSTLDAAASVAKLYGAPDEACKRILMLKKSIKEAA